MCGAPPSKQCLYVQAYRNTCRNRRQASCFRGLVQKWMEPQLSQGECFNNSARCAYEEAPFPLDESGPSTDQYSEVSGFDPRSRGYVTVCFTLKPSPLGAIDRDFLKVTSPYCWFAAGISLSRDSGHSASNNNISTLWHCCICPMFGRDTSKNVLEMILKAV